MNDITNIFNFFNSSSFSAVVLLIVLIFYSLYALVLAFQIFTFNRLLVQNGFATIFKLVALVHVAISFILLLLTVLAL